MENDEFNQIFQRLLYLIQLTSKDALAVEGRIQGTMDEHRKYLDALQSGDGFKAYQIMIHHLMMPLKIHENIDGADSSVIPITDEISPDDRLEFIRGSFSVS